VHLVRVETRAFVDVAVRARELGCPIPVGIALLPGNFATAASAAELRYHKAAPEVRSAWLSIGLTDAGPNLKLKKALARVMTGENGDCTAASSMSCSEGLSPFSRPQAGWPGHAPCGETVSHAETNNESADIPLVAFFGRELRSGPARLFTYALGAVASVLSAHTGEAGAPEIRFDAVVERPGRGSYARVEYRGDACELVELAGTVREILMGSPSPGTDDDEGA
jgi:hypothetical protein